MSSVEPIDLGEAQHGTTSGYKKGCRCIPCRNAKRLDWQQYKARQAAASNGVEGFPDEEDQVASLLKELVLRVRCECGEWHEGADPGFQCPNGAVQLEGSDPQVQ